MKNKKYIFILILLFSLVVYSCNNDKFLNLSETKFSKQQAKEFFTQSGECVHLLNSMQSSANTKSHIHNRDINWDNAIYRKTEQAEFYMVPIIEPMEYTALLTVNLLGEKKTKSKSAKVSSHLVVKRGLTTNTISQYISTIIGEGGDEESYLITGKRDKGFKGFVIISNLKGERLLSYNYESGTCYMMRARRNKPTEEDRNRNIFLQLSASYQFIPQQATKGGDNPTSYGDAYCYNCHRESNFASGSCERCGFPITDLPEVEVYYFCEKCGMKANLCVCGQWEDDNPNKCPYCDNIDCQGECTFHIPEGGSGSGTGGNGGNGHNDEEQYKFGVEYTPKDGDVFVNKRILDITFASQVVNTCFFTSLENLGKIYRYNLNTGTLINEFIKKYENIKDDDNNYLKYFNKYITEGVPLSNILNFVKEYFYTAKFRGYTDAIDRGRCILSAITTSDNSILHAIVIVGHRIDNTLIYVDPYNGKVMVDSDNKINSNINIAITSAK